IDAAEAAQMVLNVVEPQPSGIGGGAFLLYFDAASGEVKAFDGREAAPMKARPGDLRYVEGDGGDKVVPNARQSGRAVGVPGVLRVLELAHGQYGSQPWGRLIAPAIQLARDGFAVSRRMAASVADAAPALARDPEAA